MAESRMFRAGTFVLFAIGTMVALSACGAVADFEKTEWSDGDWALACEEFDGWSWVSAEPVFVLQRVCSGHSGSTSPNSYGLHTFRTFPLWDTSEVSVSRLDDSEETNPYRIADDAVKVGECFASERRSGSLGALEGGGPLILLFDETNGEPPYAASGRIPTHSGYCEATVWSLDDEIGAETAAIFDGSRHG